MGANELARTGVRELPLYAPDGTTCDIDVSDNTNLWGAPPAALRMISSAMGSSVSRYPSVYSEPLRGAILQYVELTDASVVTGCGSDDVLDSTMRAFGDTGNSIAYSVPTFSMIPVLARLNGLALREVPLMPDFDVDAEQLVDCEAKITYLCAPNNPTATSISRSAVEYVVARARGIVMLDEAYAEFAPETFADLVANNDRLIVVRTFSKAFGLAGLRVGYGVGSREIIRLVERARGPYKVSSLAERAVLATLDTTPDGLGWVREHAALAVTNRNRLAAALSTLGLPVLPSAASFVMVPLARAREIGIALREQGVLVRPFTGLPLEIPMLAASNGAALRIGVGPWEMMQGLLDRLAPVL
ncbi:MAG: hypothetical protein JWM95_3726 [Gemmatimonadetes bacterium]|nr:hypothetical protein [Gemmatimonadota bacterium]